MRTIKWVTLFALILGLFAVVASGCDKSENATETPKAEQNADDAKPADKAADNAAAAKPADPGEVKTFAASHVLIAYKGAMRANENITRTKEEAEKLARQYAGELAKNPEKLEEYAKKYSDGPSGPAGGDLGSWIQGMFVPEFEQATVKLKVGEVTAEPIETPFGYHIIRRNKAMEQVEVAAKQIVIQFAGALGAEPSLTRTKEQAMARAEEAATKLGAAPDKFSEIGKIYNDAPTDHLPIWITGQRMPKEFDEAVLALQIDQVSKPVESPFGFHVFKRIKVEHQPLVAGSHILIQYTGAKGARPNITLTKAEALAKAERLLKDIQADPTKFGEMALRESDDPMVTRNKGALGSWEQGSMLPEFDNAIAKLKVGEIGGPVETPLGYHIIMRTDPKPEVEIDFGN